MLTESDGATGTGTPSSEVKQGELVTRDWLQNYRSYLKRILLGKGFGEDRINPYLNRSQFSSTIDTERNTRSSQTEDNTTPWL